MPAGDRRARLAAILDHRPIRTLRSVLQRYDDAGGSLLAGGLAFSAMFAIVPMLFLAVGIAGLVVGDPAERDKVAAQIASVLPPLRGVVGLVLAEAARSAGAISLVGAGALAWGGSRFMLAFEEATTRVVGGPRSRNALARNVVSLVAAIVLVAAVVLGALIAGVADFLDLAAAAGSAPGVVSLVSRLVLTVLPAAVATLALLLVYRFVPESRPTWPAARRPAWVMAVVLTVFARAFVYVAPRLIGAAATVGALATLFAALAWLGLSFQAILLGAAWVREREVRRVAEAGQKAT